MMRDDGGIRCDEVLAVLSDYLDGQLDAETRERVMVHLEACENCARFGAGFATAMGSLVRLSQPDGQSARDGAASRAEVPLIARLRAALAEEP